MVINNFALRRAERKKFEHSELHPSKDQFPLFQFENTTDSISITVHRVLVHVKNLIMFVSRKLRKIISTGSVCDELTSIYRAFTHATKLMPALQFLCVNMSIFNIKWVLKRLLD